MQRHFNNLVEATNQLIQEGYTDNLKLLEDSLFCSNKDLTIKPEDIQVDAVYRFEENSDPADNSVLYLISVPSANVKGLLIDAFGVYADQDDHPVMKLIRTQPTVVEHKYEGEEGFKYGVRIVYKANFEEQPDRYELRKGYPDFPSCPWGNTFSMLGYDKESQEYVWLVSSIMKDQRLKTVQYA